MESLHAEHPEHCVVLMVAYSVAALVHSVISQNVCVPVKVCFLQVLLVGFPKFSYRCFHPSDAKQSEREERDVVV